MLKATVHDIAKLTPMQIESISRQMRQWSRSQIPTQEGGAMLNATFHILLWVLAALWLAGCTVTPASAGFSEIVIGPHGGILQATPLNLNGQPYKPLDNERYERLFEAITPCEILPADYYRSAGPPYKAYRSYEAYQLAMASEMCLAYYVMQQPKNHGILLSRGAPNF